MLLKNNIFPFILTKLIPQSVYFNGEKNTHTHTPEESSLTEEQECKMISGCTQLLQTQFKLYRGIHIT